MTIQLGQTTASLNYQCNRETIRNNQIPKLDRGEIGLCLLADVKTSQIGVRPLPGLAEGERVTEVQRVVHEIVKVERALL